MDGKKQILFYGFIIIFLFTSAGCKPSNSVINPEIIRIDASTATIAWVSEKPYRGQINYYAAGNPGVTKTAQENFSHSYRHEVRVDGLEAGTQYLYWIGDDETKYFFRTQPQAVKPFSFLVELDNLSDQITSLLMSEMPEFILSFSRESKTNYYQSIKPYVPLYDLNGQKSDYLNPENKLDDTADSWKLDWGGLCLIFIDDAPELNKFLDSHTAHTTGIIIRKYGQKYIEPASRTSALHQRIIDHNKKFPSNKIAFVLMPGPKIASKKVDTINYMQLPLVEAGSRKKTTVIRFDVNIEATYAVLLDTGDEITLKLPPLKENRTCEECRRLASTGSYKESVLAYQEFINNNQGHFQIDDAVYAVADILDTKLFQYKAAVQWYHKLVSGYPDSTLVPLASQRLEYIAKYADYEFIPLRRFEQIRRVEFQQNKDDSSGRQKILAEVDRIIEQYPEAAIAPVIYYWLANQYRNHNIAKARETYLALLKKFPGHPHAKEVWWEIGEAYYDAKKYKNAMAAFNEALITLPAAAEDINSQIDRAKRNLRRRHLNKLSVAISVLIIIGSVFWPPTGIQLNSLFAAAFAFILLLFLFSVAGWLIAEQFSSINELIIIATGMAAAFSSGFPFSQTLANKILRISHRNSEPNSIFTAACGIMLNFIFAAAFVYSVVFYTNEHYLTIVKI
ncbi:hypothetical protein D1AOALGA4SA_6590 [Olavius algarvensis Delta 1 endosymbiont]|nr:hypothetical protein D1AOALGA4SA_6590 [Olavius algarvensis Delta 1 endosymbiont]